MPKLLIKLDAELTKHKKTNNIQADPTTNWTYMTSTQRGQSQRHYYAANWPLRAVLVMRNGADLADLAGPDTYITALIGWHDGTTGQVHEKQRGRRHTLISIDTIHHLTPEQAKITARDNGLQIATWSHILKNIPRARQNEPPVNTEALPIVRVQVEIATEDLATILRHGKGDIATGLHRICLLTQKQKDQL